MNRRIEPSLGPPPASDPRRVERRRPRSYDDGMVSLIPRVMLTTLFGAVVLMLGAIGGLRWIPPPTSAYMLQSPVKPVQYHWVPAGSIAEAARRAVVASEDQKFWTHHGFDVEAIEKAEAYNKNPRHHRRGASTISQQTAKNLFLWPEGGYFRKAIEAGITILLEHLWTKDRILEVYLNIAEFGPGVYGVEAASQAYFHKPAARLSTEEAATLAAVLPNPRRWSARAPGPYVQSRADWIMGQMGYGHAPAEEPLPPPGMEPDEDGAASSAQTAPEQNGEPAPEPPVEPPPASSPVEQTAPPANAPVQQAPSN